MIIYNNGSQTYSKFAKIIIVNLLFEWRWLKYAFAYRLKTYRLLSELHNSHYMLDTINI